MNSIIEDQMSLYLYYNKTYYIGMCHCSYVCYKELSVNLHVKIS